MQKHLSFVMHASYMHVRLLSELNLYEEQRTGSLKWS